MNPFLFTFLVFQKISLNFCVTSRNNIGPRTEYLKKEYTGSVNCPHYRYGPSLDIRDLVGVWLTVYTQPTAVSCFTLNVRATTELLQNQIAMPHFHIRWVQRPAHQVTQYQYKLSCTTTQYPYKEREQNMMIYGNFSGDVDWSKCLLEVESVYNKHYLQGDGSMAGLLENIIIINDKRGYKLQEENADQWRIFGRRGNEILLMKDCSEDATALFARAPFWPTPNDLFSVLHRSGIQPLTQTKVMCEPFAISARQCLGPHYNFARKP